jgi:hypothetical protein
VDQRHLLLAVGGRGGARGLSTACSALTASASAALALAWACDRSSDLDATAIAFSWVAI